MPPPPPPPGAVGIGTLRPLVGPALDPLTAAAASGEPQELVSGMGDGYGRWVIRSLTVREPLHMENGRARKQEFTLTISYYGEDDEEGIAQEALQAHN